jgi:N-acetylneuraminate lyase
MRNMQVISKLSGVNVAFNTPIASNGDIDAGAAYTLAKKYRDVGVNGLYVCGTTGEGLMLSLQERKDILEAVVDAVGNDMAIIVHIADISTRNSVELAKHAASFTQVDAVSAIPCAYYILNDDEVKQNWLAILKSMDLPFLIYNIPGNTNYNLPMKLFMEMASIEQVYGIKNTSMNAYQIEQFRRKAGKDFLVFNGPDEQYLAGRLMGANGGIGGSYGTMPELFFALEKKLMVEKDIEKAYEIQGAINDIIEKLYSHSFCAAAKAVISERFVPIGPPRLPQAPLKPESIEPVKKIAAEIDLLVNKYFRS